MNIYRIVFSIAKDICSYKRSVKKKMMGKPKDTVYTKNILEGIPIHNIYSEIGAGIYIKQGF